MTLEYLACTDFELKAADGADEGVFEGYGSVTGNRDLGGDVVLPGAFARATARRTKMLWQHDPRQPIGVWDELAEDGNGLRLKGRLALKTRRGAEAYELLKMGALDGLSIGFTMERKDFEFDAKANTRRIKAVNLMEVSLVTFPMNTLATTTRVKARDADVPGALSWLRKAIVLHQAHMDGTEPTSDASQARMMRQMEKAYELLGGEPIEELGGDDGDKGGRPRKPMSMPMKSATSKRELERFLRDAGLLSASEAKWVAGLTQLPAVSPETTDPSATPDTQGQDEAAAKAAEHLLRELRNLNAAVLRHGAAH